MGVFCTDCQRGFSYTTYSEMNRHTERYHLGDMPVRIVSHWALFMPVLIPLMNTAKIVPTVMMGVGRN